MPYDNYFGLRYQQALRWRGFRPVGGDIPAGYSSSLQVSATRDGRLRSCWTQLGDCCREYLVTRVSLGHEGGSAEAYLLFYCRMARHDGFVRGSLGTVAEELLPGSFRMTLLACPGA